MKAAKLREQTVEELAQSARDLAAEIAAMRIKKGIGEKQTSVVKLRNMKRDLARIYTVLAGRKREASRNA